MKNSATICCVILAMLATSTVTSAQIIPWGYNPYGMQQTASRNYGRYYVAPRARYFHQGHYGGGYGFRRATLHEFEVERQLRRQANSLESLELDSWIRSIR